MYGLGLCHGHRQSMGYKQAINNIYICIYGAVRLIVRIGAKVPKPLLLIRLFYIVRMPTNGSGRKIAKTQLMLCFIACVIARLSRTHARIQIYGPRIYTHRKKYIYHFFEFVSKYKIGPRCHPKQLEMTN